MLYTCAIVLFGPFCTLVVKYLQHAMPRFERMDMLGAQKQHAKVRASSGPTVMDAYDESDLPKEDCFAIVE
eukprot:5660290-Karenia_brevis.AAC.1